MNKQRIIAHLVLAFAILLAGGASFAFAQDEPTSAEIDKVNEQITEKRAQINQLNNRIDEYRDSIKDLQGKQVTLENELGLFENQIAKAELDIATTALEIDTIGLEIEMVNQQISAQELQLTKQKDLLESVIFEMYKADDISSMQIVFGTENFSDVFDHLQYLESTNEKLSGVVKDTIKIKDTLEFSRDDKENKADILKETKEKLRSKRLALEGQMTAQEVLISETSMSEAQFQSLVLELKQEQQYVNQQVAALQRSLEQRLYDMDDIGDSSVMIWPADPSYRGISAYYHDPTYPYRHLFEHSGVDIPAPQGSPLIAAAPGYVAWAKTGRSYGNYVMIVHTNGRATLYAHMSKMYVEADQFVNRGEVIGLSGGMPGTQGAGLSTGPHLHFEVRQDGIPVNPLDYLIAQ